MCEFCKSEKKAYGYCIRCGKAICKDCAYPNDQKRHAKCGGPVPTPEPIAMPEPEEAPEE